MRWFDDYGAGDAPAMHALVVGVGDYDHLFGGSQYERRRAPLTLGLGQLTSPPASALAFATWLQSGYANRNAPLGSIELLVSARSDKPPGGMAFPDEGTTFAEIRDAFERWRNRCDGHPRNIAMFYFSGHGIEGASSFLLPSDFGADAAAPFARAIDFTATFRGMEYCRADCQLYFIDACRNLSVEAVGAKGAELASFRLDIPPYGRSAAPIYRACGLGLETSGHPGKPSLFTSTLIRCLNNFGAECRYSGRWMSSTATIGPALARLMAGNDSRPVTGICQGESGLPRPIHEIEDPKVLATVVCNPSEALNCAELRSRRETPAWNDRRAPKSVQWELEIDPGVYDFGAFFKDGEYASGWHKCGQIVIPPYFFCDLDV